MGRIPTESPISVGTEGRQGTGPRATEDTIKPATHAGSSDWWQARVPVAASEGTIHRDEGSERSVVVCGRSDLPVVTVDESMLDRSRARQSGVGRWQRMVGAYREDELGTDAGAASIFE